ncbi:MAG: YhcN/YlaJ family sporulation lipoprotein [Tumebacillaceae bacterium]
MNFSRSMTALLVTLTTTLLVGCSPQAVPKLTKEQAPTATPEGVQYQQDIETPIAEKNPKASQVGQLHTPQRTIRAPQVDGQRAQTQSLTDAATDIANTVNRIPGVERAAVLLTGKTALVGVDLASNISGSKIDTIKYSVKEAAERSGNGYHAVVTADIDTVTRVRALIAGVRNGKPVSTVSDEIADIVSRLLPEM